MDRSCAALETPIGRLWAVVSAKGLVAISRGELPPAGATLDDGVCASVLGELEAYFAGEGRTFAVELDVGSATPFDAAVWRAAREIPYCTTVSYGELAIMAGHPRAARAVGGAMSRCPFLPVVPCHRVIHADGGIGGWGGELWVKRWLLDFERAGGRSARP